MADTNFLWQSSLLASATFLINSNTGNETGFSALTNGSAVSSSVSGTSGVFSPVDWGYGMMGEIEFNAGGSFTPTAGGALLGWFRRSLDGGSTFETLVTTPSTTVSALERGPDFVIPFSAVALASGNRVKAATPVLIPPVPFMVTVQNRAGATLPTSTTNWIKMIAYGARGAS